MRRSRVVIRTAAPAAAAAARSRLGRALHLGVILVEPANAAVTSARGEERRASVEK